MPPSCGHRHRQVNRASDGVAADRPADRGVSLVLFGIAARDGQLQVALLTSTVPAAQQSSCSAAVSNQGWIPTLAVTLRRSSSA
jgi:hypothetical protein